MATQTRKTTARKAPARRSPTRPPAVPAARAQIVRPYPAGTMLLIGWTLFGWHWAPFLAPWQSQGLMIGAVVTLLTSLVILGYRWRATTRRNVAHVKAGRR